METINKNNRVVWADLLRIIAMFAVVILHVAANSWWNTAGVESFEWQVMNLWDGIVRWCVPVFVMISGMFFLNPEKEISTKNIYCKYILRIAVAFVIWSLLYALQTNLLPLHAYGTEAPAFSRWKFVSDLIGGHYHLWFLYMIAGLYMVTPLLRVITKHASKRQLTYFLTLCFLFAAVVPMLLTIPALEPFAAAVKNLNLYMVLGYVGFFVGGYYYSVYSLKKPTKIILYILGVLSLIWTVVGNSIVCLNDMQPGTFYFENLTPNVMITSAAIFVFFKEEVSKIRFGARSSKVICGLSAGSFGVYLMHVFGITAFNLFGIEPVAFNPMNATMDMGAFSYIAFNPIISIPVMSIIIFVVCLLLSWLLSKIPVVGKYIV